MTCNPCAARDASPAEDLRPHAAAQMTAVDGTAAGLPRDVAHLPDTPPWLVANLPGPGALPHHRVFIAVPPLLASW